MTGRWPNCCFQAVGVELRLLLARRAGRASCAWPRPRQRLAVVAPQDVIDEALALRRSACPADLVLAVARLVERPAGFLEQQVDEVVAGLGLGVVVRVRRGGVRLLRLGDLGPQPRQFGVERVLVGQQRRELLVPLAQLRLQLLELVDGLLRDAARSSAARSGRTSARRRLGARARRCGPASSRRGTVPAPPSARRTGGSAGGCGRPGCRAV